VGVWAEKAPTTQGELFLASKHGDENSLPVIRGKKRILTHD
jgi:hypothetical protein